MDDETRELLYIIYSMKITPSRYIDIYRKMGSNTGKANKYFLKSRLEKKPVEDGFSGMEEGDAFGDRQYDNILKSISEERFRAICIGREGYPAGLENIYLPPPVLFSLGKSSINGFNIAVVGSRRCTRYGREAVSYISRNLSEIGVTVVSGLALGIDSVAHEKALKASGGSIAVLGTGPDVIYPPENRRLFEEIIGNGNVITEFPPGMLPLRQNFPVRNRIISGISRGVIIVEAGSRSGAMITGEIALEQNREVFAVPGSIFSSASKGCHRLIKNGAKLVDCIDDILEEFGCLFKDRMAPGSKTVKGIKRQIPSGFSKNVGSVYNHIGYNAVSLEELGLRCGMPANEILNVLTFLEMESMIAEGPSNHYSRCD